MQTSDLDHFYELGDVYQTIDTCDQLETQLSRLKRQHVLGDEEWLETKSGIEAIRSQLERRVEEGLKPKGPRL